MVPALLAADKCCNGKYATACEAAWIHGTGCYARYLGTGMATVGSGSCICSILQGQGNATGFADPAFQELFKKQSGGKNIEDDIVGASMAWIGDVFSGAAHSWEDLAHVRAHWDGPILLKGIQHPEDALKAWEMNMDGIVVSNQWVAYFIESC